MSKKIATDLTRQESVDFDPNEDVRAEDFKRLFKAQNFVGVHKGMRFGGVTYDGTITGTDTSVRNHEFITLAGYFQRPIDGEGYSLQYDFYAKNITITADVYNVDTDTQIATHTMDRPESSLGWEQFTFNIPVKDATQDGTLTGDEALIEIRFTFADNGATWELGHLDVTEEIIEDTDRLIFRRTTVAIDVQNDGTLEVSDADTLNFGAGLTATNPSGSTAKIIGPKNTNQATSYDEINFTDTGDINVTVSTTSITGGTRLDVDVDENFSDTDTRVDIQLNGADETFNVDKLNFIDNNNGVTVAKTQGTNSDDVDIGFGVDESELVHNQMSLSPDDHFSAGNQLSFDGSGNLDVDDTLSLSAFVASGRLEGPELRQSTTAAIDLTDSGGTSTRGELASWCTVYGWAVGSKFDGSTLTVGNTENCSLNYNTSTTPDTLEVTFDDTFNSGNSFAPLAVAQNTPPQLSNKTTSSVDFQFDVDPGRFTVVMVGWDSSVA